MKKYNGTCTDIALDLKTYFAGQDQATHPNVIAFKEPWCGYKYYMGYTTFPYANGFEENPCIAGSNDLIHWEKPDGIRNPIALSEETECDELKDSHLIYREDLDRLEMWYLGRLNSSKEEGGPLYCFRKCSNNLKDWSSFQIVYKFEQFNLVSPSIIWDGKQYIFWGIRRDCCSNGLYRMESSDGVNWSEPACCNINFPKDANLWHGSISYENGLYRFVWVGYEGSAANNIFYSESRDGINFNKVQKIIENNKGWSRLYRPDLIFSEGKYYCFYGVVRIDGKWLIGASSGKEIQELKGISLEQIPFDRTRISTTWKLKANWLIQTLKDLFIPMLLPILVFILLFVYLIVPISWVILLLGVALSSLMYFLRFNKKSFLLGGLFMGILSSSIAVLMGQILFEMVLFLNLLG